MVDIAVDRVAFGSGSAAAEPAIDADHLARMTLGDRDLERELLRLFHIQTRMLIERMRDGPESGVASCAHTLKGSARGIGAWRVAGAAEQVERRAGGGQSGFEAAMDELVGSVAEARAAIERLLRIN